MIKRSLFYLLLLSLGVVLFFNQNFKTVAAGIAILLFGMIMLEEGFQLLAKGTLKTIIKKTTDKIYKSIATGALVTALIQSSSLVSIIAISFISVGLISLSSGMGLIFGANIGTTATSWLVAVFGLKIQLSSLAMPMLVFGIIFSLQKRNSLKGFGNILAGLGFFFLGVHYMKEGFEVFKEYIDLTQYSITGFWGVMVYFGIGIVITTVLQSSSATVALILTALAAGQIEYENALALVVGANVGTTITAILGSISTNIAGKRLAGAHLIFNFVTGLVALSIIKPLANLVDLLSTQVGIGPEDYTLKLALFHTIFNFLGVLIMLPFIKLLERFLIYFFKDNKNKGIEEPKFLNESVLKLPNTVLASVTEETKHLFENAIFEIVTHALNIHRSDIQSNLKPKEIVKISKEDFQTNVRDLYYNKVKSIYGEIIKYVRTAQSTLKMSAYQNDRLSELIVANRKMVEIIKNVLEMGRNISQFQSSGNELLTVEYDKFRKKIIKVLRVIYLFRTNENKEQHYAKLVVLRNEAKSNKYQTNKSINALIRQNLITSEMASSLVNDKDNMHDIINNLISVSELLYGEKDSLLENGE